MRYNAEHKEQTRRKVLHEASIAMRAVGPEHIGVADVMAKAGLTHGGFYAHFKSKDDLIAQTITQMFEDSYELFRTRTENPDPAEALSTFINGYVSRRHRDAPEAGCPIPSLSGDLRRMPTTARERFEKGVERLTQSLANLMKQLKHAEPERLAASVLAEMVGAVALSRAIADTTASDRILKSSRDAIRSRLGLPLQASPPKAAKR